MIGKRPSRGFTSPWNISRTLQVNIIIAFASLLIFTVVVIAIYSYQQNSKAVLALSDDLIDQVTSAVIEKTTNYLEPAAFMAQTSAGIPNIDSLSLVENKELETYGIELLERHPQLSGFFIGNQQGDFLFTKRFAGEGIGTQTIDRSLEVPLRIWTYRNEDGSVREQERTENPPYDPRQRPWYIGASEVNNLFWTDIYIFFTDQKPGITAAYPMHNQNNELVGVIGIDVALDELSAFLQTQKVGENGVAFILNNEGEIVAYPGVQLATPDGESFRPVSVAELDNPFVVAAYQQYRDVERLQGNGRFNLDVNKTNYIASFTPFPDDFGKEWEIGIVVPEDDFIGAIRRTNQISLGLSFAILVFAIMIAIFISRSISRPIEQLTAETEKIKDFQLDGKIEINSPITEVKRLEGAISGMKAGLKAFKKYVPDELVRQLILTGQEAQLGGTRRELTIMFTDVAGFTSLSEGMVPEELMGQLSDYLGELASIVIEQSGTVDKFMGDGLMAFWGAPLKNQHHAYYACKAALLIRQKSHLLNEQWQKEGKPIFPTRIGIHTGETLVGNMGSEERMNYTVLGDSVNLASRLEPINDFYGTEIIVSHATYETLQTQFLFRPLDVVTVKGKKEFVLLYELLAEKGETTPELELLAQDFAVGFEAFIAQEWAATLKIFRKIHEAYPDDVATQIYLERIKKLVEEPPDPSWQPIRDLSKPQDLFE